MAEAGPAEASPDTHSLGRLLAWLSPGFPVGAYAYSHGLEWAVEQGDVGDAPSLVAWLEKLLFDGAGRNDAILLAAAHRSASAHDHVGLMAANDLALALAPSGELYLETAQQGRSFLDAVLAAWPAPGIEEAASCLGRSVAYPVALGLACACHGVPVAQAVRGHLAGFAGNLVSAAIRLAPVGQTAGQRVLAGLGPKLDRLARDVLRLDLDDVAASTFRADLGSLRHETQYTRLFRS